MKKSTPDAAGGLPFAGIETDRFWAIACVGEQPLDQLQAGDYTQRGGDYNRFTRSLSEFIPDPQRKFLEKYQGGKEENDFVAGERVAAEAVQRIGAEKVQAMIGVSRKSKSEKKALLAVLREHLGLSPRRARPQPAPAQTQVIFVQPPTSPPGGKKG